MWVVALGTALAMVLIGCGGAVLSEDGRKEVSADAGTTIATDASTRGPGPVPSDDATSALRPDSDEGTTFDAPGSTSATACHDDRPAPGAVFVDAGAPCTLADGGVGVGNNRYGCVDPSSCKCKPEGGDASCVPGAETGLNVVPAPVCVYASCSGATQDDLCALPGGRTGTCCAGRCVDPASYLGDPNNCGNCGLACWTGSACINGDCTGPAPPECGSLAFGPISSDPALHCPTGRVCALATRHLLTPLAPGQSVDHVGCASVDCTSLPDGSPCQFVSTDIAIGMCCSGACIDPGGTIMAKGPPSPCGACGVVCCPGTNCWVGGICD